MDLFNIPDSAQKMFSGRVAAGPLRRQRS